MIGPALNSTRIHQSALTHLLLFLSVSSPMSAAAASSSSSPLTTRRKVIIDTDAGCDDAVAILMLLRDPSIDVIGITCVYGNVKLDQAVENIFTILRVFNRLDIPFYRGAGTPLVVDIDIKTWPGHGTNGLGDASFIEGAEQHDHETYMKRVNHAVQKEHAVQGLIEMSKKHPGEIDIIALGPLTNLALGIRMDPQFTSRFRHLYIMGASVYAKGNASMAAEFNWYCDPEGAFVTLAHYPSLERKVVIVPWETTESASLTWTEFDELTAGFEEHIEGDENTKHRLEASFLKKTHAKYEYQCRAGHRQLVEEKKLQQQQNHPSSSSSHSHSHNNTHPAKRTKSNSGAPIESTLTADQIDALNELPSLGEIRAAASSSTAIGIAEPLVAVGTQSYQTDSPADYVCCDSYTTAVYLHPEMITTSVTHYAEVVIQGTSDVRGMLAIDWCDRKQGERVKDKKVTIVTGIDKKKYLDCMRHLFQPTTQETKPGTRKRNH